MKKQDKILTNKCSSGGGSFYNLLNKNIKELGTIKLSIISIIFLILVGLISYKMTNSYALFSDSVVGTKTIETTVDLCSNNKPNAPVLDSAMIPVYYDENTETWKKADSTNKNNNWYDYCDKKWANSVTYDHTTAYDESTNPKGYAFDGVDDYIDMGNANYDFGKTITIATRFKVNKLSASQEIVSQAESAGTEIYVTAANKIRFNIYGTTSKAWKGVDSTITVEENKWYTVVGTYDGTTSKIYVNGTLDNTLSLTDTIKTSTQPYFLGANPNANGTHTSFLNGIISNALVLKETLSASEISKNYKDYINYTKSSNEVFYKNFGNESSGTITNGNYTSEGMKFNGTDYINAGNENYNFNKNATIAARFKVNKLDTTQSIVSQAEGAGIELYVTAGNKILFNVYGATSKAWKGVSSTITVEENKWYTVVGTYDGTTSKLYINGTLNNTLSLTDTIKTSSMPILVGANPEKNNSYMSPLNGTISDATVLHQTLSENEIKSNYSNELNYKKNDNALFYYNLRNYESRKNGETIPMSMIKTMQVWIPRYKYKVWNYNADGTKTSNEQQIEITWENGTAKTGEITCQDAISGTDGDPSETCKLKSTNTTCTDETCNNKTYTHPAFTFGNTEIKGFWIGKFELTGTISNITTKPDLQSIIYQKISAFETNIMNMKNSGNSYGISTTTDTHMIKNTEWGAVAYLSHSKYGTCTNGTCKEVNLNNSSSYYTGRSGGSSSADPTSAGTYKYNQIKSSDGTLIGAGQDGPSASTTHNIYGVYDMNGGAYDYTMGNIVSPDGTTMMSGYNSSSNSGYTGKIYDSGNYTSYTGIAYPDSKYYDKYSYSISYTTRIRSKLGDGIKEVYNGSNGWYGDSSRLAYSSGPWVGRGGNYNAGAFAGVFYSGSGSFGSATSYSSSRLIITP